MSESTGKSDSCGLSELIAADEKCLNGRGRDELAEWWCLLNKWGWPHEIPNPEDVPKETKNFSVPRRSALMREIEDRVTHKHISYVWNRDRMSEEEHSNWYTKTFGI